MLKPAQFIYSRASVDLRIQTYTEPVALKYGKLAANIRAYTVIFLQCSTLGTVHGGAEIIGISTHLKAGLRLSNGHNYIPDHALFNQLLVECDACNLRVYPELITSSLR